ncbi:MAG: peptidoglycan DD-metalloendopeptidase family protein, partial [Planctomycetaceae bacterium]|nr:peptidoglycan DD-metalloendopeptidase family protein [Planctomycetaceae bacterium]
MWFVSDLSLRSLLKHFRRRSSRGLTRRTTRRWMAAEVLEDRALLANITVTGAHLRDAFGGTVTNPVQGESVALQVEFATMDLAPGASYRIDFSIDGVSNSISGVTLGAGLASGSWFQWTSGWFTVSGMHSATVTVDADGAVAETDETDNSAALQFTTVTATDLPQKLSWPVEGSPQLDNFIVNYVDVNPAPGAAADFQGGIFTADGHDAWDIGPGTFDRQDEGIPVYAAADGVVTAIHDGEFDRQTEFVTPQPQANFVQIDHGSGWATDYWHLRRDSIVVVPGQSVQAGDLIGYMGSSGISDGTHLHFGLKHHGLTVEPMMDPSTYLLTTPSYSGTSTLVRRSYTTNYDISQDYREPASEVSVFPSSSPFVSVAALFSGFSAGDVVDYVWRRPDNSIEGTDQSTIPVDSNGYWIWWNRTLPAAASVGVWTVEFLVNNVRVGEQSFEVASSSGPEIRVELASDPILNDRFTPVSFGPVVQGSPSPVRTFRVTNHGYSNLTTGTITLPVGFTITEGLLPILTPGSSDTFTVSLSAASAGSFGGTIEFTTNDPSDARFRFSVEGLVTPPVGESLSLGFSERTVPEGGRVQGRVTRTGSTAAPLAVDLISSDSNNTRLQSSSIVIPAGAAAATFVLDAIEDGIADGPTTISITATAAGFASALNRVEVHDAMPLPLTLSGTSASNTIRVVNSTPDPTRIRFFVDGEFRRSVRLADISGLTIDGQSGTDMLFVDFASG